MCQQNLLTASFGRQAVLARLEGALPALLCPEL